MSGGPLPAWPLPLRNVTLGAGEVHVWRASLRVPEPQMAQLYATLSADERERAGRYRFLHDRQHFVAARAWLRALLSTYLGTTPGQVHLRYNPHGKPELDSICSPNPSRAPSSMPVTMSADTANRAARDTLHFNLSHSDDLVLYAMTRGRQVGIDVERVRPGFADETLAERFFSPRELATLRSLPAAEQERAFFAGWVRKEAYFKARGEGLTVPMDSLNVSLAPRGTAALLSSAAEQAEQRRWSLHDLDVGPDYVAALAVEGHGWELLALRLAAFDWPSPS